MDINNSENKFQEQLTKSLNEKIKKTIVGQGQPIPLPLNVILDTKHSEELEEIKKLIETHTKVMNEIKSTLEKLSDLVKELVKKICHD